MPASALICLDDFTLAGAVAARFKLYGWRCLVGEFLRTALKHQPDLLVVDAHADYLIKALKADARTARLTIVAIGRTGDTELKARALEAGALTVIARPMEGDPFDTFTRFIEHGRSGAARGHPNKSLARPAPAALA